MTTVLERTKSYRVRNNCAKDFAARNGPEAALSTDKKKKKPLEEVLKRAARNETRNEKRKMEEKPSLERTEQRQQDEDMAMNFQLGAGKNLRSVPNLIQNLMLHVISFCYLIDRISAHSNPFQL